MLKKSSLLSLVFASTLITGCVSNAQTSLFFKEASRVTLGRAIGGCPEPLFGGAAGVIGGGLIQTLLDNGKANCLKMRSPQTYQRVDNGEKLSVNDVIHLVRAEIADDKIIEFIQKTNSRYHLNQYQIDKLHEAGVSEQVIHYMLQTR